MLIEIDGSPIQKPPSCAKLDRHDYLMALERADRLFLAPENSRPFLLEAENNPDEIRKLMEDPDSLYNYYIVSVVKNGGSGRMGRYPGLFASNIALRVQPEEVELVDTRSNSGSFSCLGMDLRRNGFIHFKGDVEDVRALKGGIVYVEGDLDKIVASRKGIVVVKGDLKEVGSNTENVVVFVGGRVHYSEDEQHKAPNYSPHVINTEDISSWGPQDVRAKLEEIGQTTQTRVKQIETALRSATTRVANLQGELAQLSVLRNNF